MKLDFDDRSKINEQLKSLQIPCSMKKISSLM